MNVLINSRVFLPSFGGLEKMMHMIATEVAHAGHAVTVVTETTCDREALAPYRVMRQPSLSEVARAALQADVCLVANITLRATPLLLALGCKVVTTHQGWYGGGQPLDIRPWLKNQLTHLTYNVSCSEGVRVHIPGGGIVIPNSYAHENFQIPKGNTKDRDIAFLGRLVSDKGCDVLLDAVAMLRQEQTSATVTVIGTGPELQRLQDHAARLGLTDYVTFKGKLEGAPLAQELARHRILAVPSVWEEPFGIVALEGAACGCVVVGTDGGGLPEAIGPCGMVVKRGDARALAEGLRRVLTDGGLARTCLAAASAHLAQHTQNVIGARYTAVLENVVSGRPLATAIVEV